MPDVGIELGNKINNDLRRLLKQFFDLNSYLSVNVLAALPPSKKKSSAQSPNFTTFFTAMGTISHTFQHKIVLKIFKISGHLPKISDNGIQPGGNKNTDISKYACI